jgi:hypothetical protein
MLVGPTARAICQDGNCGCENLCTAESPCE